MLRLHHLLCEKIKIVTGKNVEPVFDSSGITGQPRRKCDTGKLEKELQYKTKVSFEEGLQKTIEWYNNIL